MRVIVPLDLTLDSSTATASALDEWSSVTSYTVNDDVKVSSTGPPSEWRCIQGPHTNKPPPTEPAYWVQLGVTNPYKLLDNSSSTQTTGTTAFATTVTPPQRVSHVALFNCDGVRSVTVTINYLGSPEWSQTYTLGRTDISGTWWEYFFHPGEYGDSLIEEIPAWHSSDQTVTVEVTGDTGATVSVGHLVLGLGQELGMTVYEADVGIQSYSRKDVDPWGNYVLTPRTNAKRLQGRVLLPRGTVDRAYRALAQLDARAAVWDLNNSADPELIQDSLRLFGFYRDFRLLMSGYNQDFCELELEGLV